MAVYSQIPNTIKGRRLLLEKELQKYSYKKVYCPALSRKVRIHPDSITETAYHASKSVLSTKLALRIKYIIEHAKLIQTGITPKCGTQTRKFHFKELVVLSCGIRGLGTAKLTVGYVYKRLVIEYCITDIKMKTRNPATQS